MAAARLAMPNLYVLQDVKQFNSLEDPDPVWNGDRKISSTQASGIKMASSIGSE